MGIWITRSGVGSLVEEERSGGYGMSFCAPLIYAVAGHGRNSTPFKIWEGGGRGEGIQLPHVTVAMQGKLYKLQSPPFFFKL